MYAVDPTWYSLHDAPGKQLIVLVETLAMGETYASIAYPGTVRRLLNLQSGSVGAISSQLDPWTGVTQISQMRLALNNADGYFVTLPSDMVKSPLKVLLGIGTHTSTATMLPLFSGHVERLDTQSPTLTMQAVPGAFAWHHDLSTLLGDQFFVDVPQSQRQTAIPLLVGFSRDVVCPPLTAEATGTLAQPLGDVDTTLFLKEFAAPFAPTGTVDIGTETGVTYTGRAIVTLAGFTYLRLTGLTRPAGVAHLADETVTGTVQYYRYLVGYEATVLGVRVDGVTVPAGAGGYTVETVQADFPVTVLRFPSQQGTVTADVDGQNIGDPFTLLPNGDFETGSLSPWILSGATGSATSGNAYAGTYKAQITGGYGTDGSLSQDITVPAHRGMVLQFAGLRNFEEAGNVILNGDFATNDFTSWTETHGADPQMTLVPTFLAGPGVFYDAQTDLSPLEISQGNLFLNWTATIEQSATVAIGAHRLYIESLFSDFFPTMGEGPLPGMNIGGSGGGSGPIVALAGSLYTPVSWGLLLLTVTVTSGSTVVLSREIRSHASSAPPSGPYLHGQQTLDEFLTLSSTTVTVRVQLDGQFTGITPTGLSLLKIALIPQNLASIASLSLDLGTSTDLQAYGTLDATAPPEAWATYTLPSVPTATALRVTFRTHYDNAAVAAAAWLDQVGIAEQGRNPVEVIRWLIETRIPGLAINEASFGKAYLSRADWRCGGQWRRPGHSLSLLQDLASQFELRYFENGNGEACLAPIDQTAPPVASLSAANATGWQAQREPALHLATDIYVYYAPRSGQGSQNPADYSGVVSATPEGTTGEPGLATRCATAAAAYKIRQPLRVFCTAITDQATAHLKLREVVLRHTVVGLLVLCTSPLLTMAPLELGDRIAMTHPIMGELPLVGEVISVAIDLGMPGVTITARLTEVYGLVEQWESIATTVGEGIVEAWDSA